MAQIDIILFYKFTPLAKLRTFRKELLAMMEDANVLGRILVAKEGINGSVSGTPEEVETFKKLLTADERFADLVFKTESGTEHAFTKRKVHVKEEIVTIKADVDLKDKAQYIESSELHELYTSGKDFIILDTRNDYEWKVGKFKNATTLDIENFRDFPQAVDKLPEDMKDKEIVTYCTGGIRCEKATAYMTKAGFKNVRQLHDGILTYCQQFPDTYWEGGCFVFDKRMVSKVGQKAKPITHCAHCHKESDLYKNCRNPTCDALTILCMDCQLQLHGCCSTECFHEFQDACTRESQKKQGMMKKAALTFS